MLLSWKPNRLSIHLEPPKRTSLVSGDGSQVLNVLVRLRILVGDILAELAILGNGREPAGTFCDPKRLMARQAVISRPNLLQLEEKLLESQDTGVDQRLVDVSVLRSSLYFRRHHELNQNERSREEDRGENNLLSWRERI